MTDVRPPQPGHRPAGVHAAKGKRSAAAISLIPAAVAAVWSIEEILDGHGAVAASLAALIFVWILLTYPWADGGEAGSGFSGIRRMLMIRAVRRGMANGELELHYQPQIDLETGRPYGAEALLRWRRRGALVPPGEFLPAVESSELIGPVTERVLKMAAAQAAAWRRAGRDLRVAVNLSGSNLRDFRVVSHIEGALAAHDLPADAITVEVTETTVLDNPEQTRAVLDAIAGLGVPISVDDFGAGYSSLLWLRIFPVEEVKIDRSFVSQLSGDGRAFVEGVVRLARDLALRVVAEGIEDREVLAGLHALGCEAGQGFLFARPMPAEQLERWLDSHGETDWARRETGIVINPAYEEIGPARDLVAESAAAAGLSESEVWDVRVAVTEALANAIEHGTPTADGRIHVRIAEEDDELQLEVVGGGRAPGDRPAESAGERGRGIAIMSGTMDSVHLAHDDDRDLIRLAKKIRRERGVP